MTVRALLIIPLLAALALLIASACDRSRPATAAPDAAASPDPGAASTSAPSDAAPPPPAPELMGIDLFGARKLTAEQLIAAVPELRAYAVAACTGEGNDDPAPVLGKIQALGDFAEVDPAMVTYYRDADRRECYLTIDVVERADTKRRMPFLPRPTGQLDDPDGLLAEWEAYERAFHEALSAGARFVRRDCPALHCFGGDEHPRLAPHAARLAARAPAQFAALARVLRDERDGSRRAAAAYLLAYGPDREAVVAELLRAFRDPSHAVRNSAMRVIADIAFHHPEIPVPLEPVLAALDYPATTDRNKAAAILDGLLARPGAEQAFPLVIRRAGPILLAMLRLEQPNNHDFAYSILKRVSGEAFGERDHEAWAAWLASRAQR